MIERRTLFLLVPCLLFLSADVPAAGGQRRTGSATVDSSQQIVNRLVQAKTPVLLEFWAPWCGPCRILTPVLKQLEKEYAGKILVERVNVDIHQGIASYFGIKGIPAVFIIKQKQVLTSIPGLQKKAVYVAAVEEALTAKVPAEPAKKAADSTTPNDTSSRDTTAASP